MKVTNVNVWMIGGSADVKAVKSAVRSAVDGSFCFGSEKIAMYRAVKAVRKEMERQANEVKNSPPAWMVVSFETLSGLPWMKRRSWGSSPKVAASFRKSPVRLRLRASTFAD